MARSPDGPTIDNSDARPRCRVAFALSTVTSPPAPPPTANYQYVGVDERSAEISHGMVTRDEVGF
jgi:hypothetical protein